MGAGVIFKDSLTISGITTATTIWISAALGMAVGAGEYMIAVVSSVVVLVVLTLFEKVKMWIGAFHQVRIYKVTLTGNSSFIQSLTAESERLTLRLRVERDMKNGPEQILLFEIAGKRKKLDQINTFLKDSSSVKAYEY